MKQSTLAFICGFILFVILAVSWCGRKPEPEVVGQPRPSQTPLQSATPAPTATASVAVAQASATPPPAPTPPPEFRKIAEKVRPAVVVVTIFDPAGQLLRSGTGFYVAADGRFLTSWHIVDGSAHAVAKSPDGKIRNVTGVLASSQELDLAVLRAETKTGVPFLPFNKIAEPEPGAFVAVIGSTLEHKEQPLVAGSISPHASDQPGNRFEISAPVPKEAEGAPVLDLNGDVVGLVTLSSEQGATGKNFVRSATSFESLLAQAKSSGAGRWAAAESESPTPEPSATPAIVKRPRVLYNPAPRYPTEARFSQFGAMRGSGRFRVVFGQNGMVKDVQMVQSTGKALLDQAALEGLRQWKAEPGREWTVLVPITFEP
jgi:TonB family protein